MKDAKSNVKKQQQQMNKNLTTTARIQFIFSTKNTINSPPTELCREKLIKYDQLFCFIFMTKLVQYLRL